MRWAENVTCRFHKRWETSSLTRMGEKRKLYKVLVGKPEGK
jgi:hypothetical protein